LKNFGLEAEQGRQTGGLLRWRRDSVLMAGVVVVEAACWNKMGKRPIQFQQASSYPCRPQQQEWKRNRRAQWKAIHEECQEYIVKDRRQQTASLLYGHDHDCRSSRVKVPDHRTTKCVHIQMDAQQLRA
jgi:hypothetical protein